MRQHLSWAILGLCLILLACQSDAQDPVSREVPPGLAPYISVANETILLQNILIIDGSGDAPRAQQDILIERDHISAIGNHGTLNYPSTASKLNLTGHSVIPGIIGMHNHLHMPGNTLMSDTAPQLYLAGGVTTIMTAGSADIIGEIKLKKAIDNGDIPGPDIVLSAPYITGSGGNGPMYKPANEEEARKFVRTWIARDVMWFKLYRDTEPHIAKALIDEAHKHGAKVTGHLCSITFSEAAEMGIDGIEHGLNSATDFVTDKPSGECVSSRRSKLDLDTDSERFKNWIKSIADRGVTITTTPAILESGFPHRPQAQEDVLEMMSPAARAQYDARQKRIQSPDYVTTSTPDYWNRLTAFDREFAKHGTLLAGPDNGRHILPGYGDQRNFELLVEAGFSPEYAVRIMTYNGAIALSQDAKIGRISPGYRVNLVVIEGDLTVNPSAIREVRYVFKDGFGYDPQVLVDDVKGRVGPATP